MYLIQLVILSLLMQQSLVAKPPTLQDILNRSYEYEIKRDITYCSPDGTPQKLDLHRPKLNQKLPVVIMIHGGGWGGRDKSHKNFQKMADRYAKRGFAVFNINYRLSKTAPAPAAVQDVHCAARYIVANADKYNIDPNSIVVTGNSAGCHLGLMLAMCGTDLCKGQGEWEGYSPKIKAVVNRFGITDAYERTFGKKPRRSAVKWFTGVQGDPKELAKQMSPVNYTKVKTLPPILTIHGDKDFNTPVSQAHRLHEGLKVAGHSTQLIIVPGGNHGLHNISEKKDQELYRSTFQFLLENKLF